MFYYLHLTRPPPEKANPSQPLLITPNIANDLRTEHPSPAEGGIDIFYAWVRCIESETRHSHSLGPMTQPQKLMTWTENSYKEVQVFPPKEALQTGRASGGTGSRWQLLLCTRSTLPSDIAQRGTRNTPNPRAGPYITSIDLSTKHVEVEANLIFPILSAPVHFTSGSNVRGKGLGAGRDKKQVRNERVFRLPSPLWKSASVGPIRVMEHLSYDLDKKVWDSGVGLSYWLVHTIIKASSTTTTSAKDDSGGSESDSAISTTVPPIVRNLIQSKHATILELGTGTGLVSIVLATLLSHCLARRPESKIIATDLPSAMEILEANLSDNGVCYPSPSIQVKAVVLDWDEYTDEKNHFPVEIKDGVDFIIMADVTYNTSSFPSLMRTLSRLSCLRPGHAPGVLLAYKERDTDERRLWDMACDIGLHLNEVGRVPGAGGIPVEIYSGEFVHMEINRADK